MLARQLLLIEMSMFFRQRILRQEIDMTIDPATAFVSYSRDDCEFALRLTRDLKAKGALVWMDKLDLRPGQLWDTEVESAVDGSSRMLVILSPASVASEKVKNEFIVALDEGKIVIPVLFRDCKVPLQLRRLQYADFRTDYSSGLQDLLSSLSGQSGAQARDGAAPAVHADSPLSEEDRKRESASFHVKLAEHHKLASAEQARLELEERNRAEAANNARQELERRRLAELARREDAQRLANRNALLQRQAAEQNAARERQERQRAASEQARLQAQCALAAKENERARARAALKARRRQEFQRIVANLAAWGQKLKHSLPPPPPLNFEATRGMVLTGALCVAAMISSVIYETVASSHLRHRTPVAHFQNPKAPTVNPELPRALSDRTEAASPSARTQPEQATVATAPPADLQQPPSKATPRNLAPFTTNSGSVAHAPAPQVLIASPPPPTVASLSEHHPADLTPPAGMSGKLADIFRAARAGDSNAMLELAAAYHLGNGVAKDNKQAVTWYRKAADAGNPRAAFDLAECYANAYGVPRDPVQAADWYRKAAAAGNSEAMNKLGYIYRDGLGLSQDYRQAVTWFRKAAEAGNARGMTNLGRMYDNGWGLPTDYRQAAVWYTKAAEAGDLQGMNSLGVMYEDGLGIKKDLSQAISWYHKAAEAGDATGMLYLADMYEYGKGQKKDSAQAFYWYRKAAEAGDARAMDKVAAMYENGTGIVKDKQQAIAWYRKAAQLENQDAKNNVKRLGESP
jgi:TPR repeat protein